MNNSLLPLAPGDKSKALTIGDRVRLTGGKHLGATGVVFGKNGEKIKVKSDQHGTIKPFDPLLLELIPGLLPVAEQLTIIDGFTGDPDWMTSTPQIEDLNPSEGMTSTPQIVVIPSVSAPEPRGLEPLSAEDLNPSALTVLEALRGRLAATALTDCWLESAGCGRIRVQYYKASGKPARYVDGKEALELRDRIAAGRALKHCDALLRYYTKS